MRETEKDEKMLQSFHKIITTPGQVRSIVYKNKIIKDLQKVDRYTRDKTISLKTIYDKISRQMKKMFTRE